MLPEQGGGEKECGAPGRPRFLGGVWPRRRTRRLCMPPWLAAHWAGSEERKDTVRGVPAPISLRLDSGRDTQHARPKVMTLGELRAERKVVGGDLDLWRVYLVTLSNLWWVAQQ